MAEAKGKEAPERVEIGFAGGQVVEVRLTPDQLSELRSEVERKGHGWYDLETDDGSVTLDLEKVVFVRKGRAERRVGFIGGE